MGKHFARAPRTLETVSVELNRFGAQGHLGINLIACTSIDVVAYSITITAILAPATPVAGTMVFDSCLVQWRAGQGESAIAYVIEMAM